MDMLEVCHPEWTLDGKPDVEGWKAEFALWCGTFRLNFHRFDRFELDLLGHAHPY